MGRITVIDAAGQLFAKLRVTFIPKVDKIRGQTILLLYCQASEFFLEFLDRLGKI